MASALPVDVIMLDMRMPEMDGPEILARLRSGAGPNQYVPVLAFTAEAELFSTYLAHGFDGVVAKPINPSDTVQAIRAAIMGEFEERACAEG